MSITGQTGHIALAKQTAFGTPNTTLTDYRAVKITGDSLVAANNMLVTEGEIGTGRDVSDAVPGGFSAAGAVNGNLRTRAAAVFAQAALGTRTAVIAGGAGATATVALDEYTPADILPVFTVEKKVGTNVRTAAELLTLRYSDVMVNTFNMSIPSGGFSTFSAGLVACGESYIGAPVFNTATPWHVTTNPGGYNTLFEDTLVFHGGRIRAKDSTDTDAVTWASGDNDSTFQSIEVVVNNNVQADEFTIRPSRFLRSLTEGIRSIELNMTIVFENFATYQKYTYGATGRTTPGYSLYIGALQIDLANWQLADADNWNFQTLTSSSPPADPQAMNIQLPKLAFSGLPVTLSTGRIAVSTTARALKPATGNIIKVSVRPTTAGFIT